MQRKGETCCEQQLVQLWRLNSPKTCGHWAESPGGLKGRISAWRLAGLRPRKSHVSVWVQRQETDEGPSSRQSEGGALLSGRGLSFVLFWPSADWMKPIHTGKGSQLPLVLIQMLFPYENPSMGTCRITLSKYLGTRAPVKLMLP